MRIGTRVSAGFASIAALLVVTSLLGWTLASQQITSTSSEQRALTVSQDAKQYQLDAAGVAVAANSVAYDFTSHSDPTADLRSLAASTAAARQEGAALAPQIAGAAERSELARAGAALDNYVTMSNQIILEFSAATPSELAAANAGVAALAFHKVTGPLAALEEQNVHQIEATLAKTSSRGAGDRLLVIALTLAALGLAGVIGTLVTRSITSRLRRIVRVLEQVAAGDMTQRIDIESSDEVGQMVRALNVALDRVEERTRATRFESRLANALDMAENEAEVLTVIESSFAFTLPDAPIELLLADNSHAHLHRAASSSLMSDVTGCAVDSPDHCPAARRGQLQHFNDSDALDACPKLRSRPGGRCQALCVPVSIMGRTVGVMHSTQPRDASFDANQLSDLETLSRLGGARIGLLRAMSDTQMQAATDSLTGLLMRRSFEQSVANMRAEGIPVSVAMADLDHFKALNDAYGHASGDRALILFAQTLRRSLRSQDIIGRHGGEEFVIAFHDCSATNAQRTLDGFRSILDSAITVAGVPRFTASFGVVDAVTHEGLPDLIGRADAALFAAKRDGRDRVVRHSFEGDAQRPGRHPTERPGERDEPQRLGPAPAPAIDAA